MQEIVGNLWDYHDAGHWIVITTNGTVSHNYYGHNEPSAYNVMGAGVAKQAKQRFPSLPYTVANLIELEGNVVYKLPRYRLYTLPVKTNWWERADIELIKRSCKQLADLVPWNGAVYIVRPGCGVGRLAWRNVKPKIEHLLDSRFVVVELPKHDPFT